MGFHPKNSPYTAVMYDELVDFKPSDWARLFGRMTTEQEARAGARGIGKSALFYRMEVWPLLRINAYYDARPALPENCPEDE